MKSLLPLAAATLALGGLAACAPGGPPAQRAALDCPETQGDLTRTAVAPDRRSCTYVTSRGAEVQLQLVATGGDPEGALRRIEAQIPAPAPGAAVAAAPTEGAGTRAAEAGATSARDAQAAVREAQADAAAAISPDSTKTITATVDVKTGEDAEQTASAGDGEVTRVRLPGISITASGDDAQVKVGGVSIDADGDHATVRMYRDVRLKGEAFSRQKRGVRATLVREGEFAGGYRVVGYEAGGPKAGPIAVAVVKSKADTDGPDGDLYEDVANLVRRNGGV
ncbi:hypothetical protein [Phenylobacterium sp.]|uniref:hypothetical protein n=1 Tax=Phenylobacterium sp. TaxID=1871053 RepID=UPI0035B48AC8